jgi:hypothetical protein
MLVTKNLFDQDMTAMDRMSKQELKQRIQNFHGHIKLDFTEDYLEAASIEHLRHILFAAIDNERYRSVEGVSSE